MKCMNSVNCNDFIIFRIRISLQGWKPSINGQSQDLLWLYLAGCVPLWSAFISVNFIHFWRVIKIVQWMNFAHWSEWKFKKSELKQRNQLNWTQSMNERFCLFLTLWCFLWSLCALQIIQGNVLGCSSVGRGYWNYHCTWTISVLYCTMKGRSRFDSSRMCLKRQPNFCPLSFLTMTLPSLPFPSPCPCLLGWFFLTE